MDMLSFWIGFIVGAFVGSLILAIAIVLYAEKIKKDLDWGLLKKGDDDGEETAA